MARRPSETTTSSELPRGVDDVHLLEPRRGTSMADRVRLPGLALAIIERAAEPIRGPAADHVHRVPEVRRVALIGDVAQHADDLSATYFVKRLAREREVVALVVNRPRANVADHDRSEERRVGKECRS